MVKKIFSWGNPSVRDFNEYLGGNSPLQFLGVPNLRIGWNRKFLPIRFSYQEFMQVATELVEIVESYRPGSEKVILGFRTDKDLTDIKELEEMRKMSRDPRVLERIDPERLADAIEDRDYFSALEQTSEIDTSCQEAIEEVWKRRQAIPFKKFNKPIYDGMQDLGLYISGFKDPFMVALSTEGQKKRLTFYGQVLLENCFRDLAKRFNKPGFTYWLESGKPAF